MRQINIRQINTVPSDWFKGWDWWLPVKLSFGVAAIGLLTTAAQSTAQSATLTDWKFDPATRQLQISIPEGTVPRYFLLAQPARIVLDLPNTQMGAVLSQQTYVGAVSQIRVGQFQEGLTRIVIELAPDAVLAPGQVELQPASDGQGSSESMWILQPLFADRPADRSADRSADSPAAVAAQPSTTQPPATQPVALASGPSASVSDGLPSLEPDAIVIPTVPAAGPAPETPTVPSASSTAMSEDNTIAELPPPSILPALPLFPQPATNAPRLDATVPTPPTVVPLTVLPTLPPAVAQPAQPITVTVPPLQPSPPTIAPVSPATASPATASPATAPSIEFGQPRPQPVGIVGSGTEVAASPNILVPAGTWLSLRYPRETVIELKADHPRQEVLLLQQAVYDRNGNTLLAEGSQVIGRFETSSSGSKFVAQAITLQGRNLLLNAESGTIGGDRQVSGSNLAVNSAIGAFALSVLTGSASVGLLGGATAGAATAYLTAPQLATIQPNQIIQLRLLTDLPRPATQP